MGHPICERVSVSPPVYGIKDLQKAYDLNSFAALIEADPSDLAFVLYKLSNTVKYNSKKIEKKSGGERLIHIPNGALKTYQRKTASLMLSCEEDIAATLGIKKSVSHAFKKQHSIFTNASMHKNKAYVLNLDLEDFFGTINFGRIFGYLTSNAHYKLNKNVAKVIAHMACLDGVLVQGSPLSPVISNMIGNILDSRILKLAKKYKCTYSRYADDITISSRRKKFPNSIAVERYAEINDKNETDWVIGTELKAVIESCGFSINQSKTRMHLKQSNQTVTGLSVNTRVNINRKKYKLIRAQVNSFTRYGKYFDVDGKVGDIKTLRGYLDYCFWIKKNNGYFTAENSNYFVEDGSKENNNLKKLSFEWVFYKFLFSNIFIHNVTPTLLFEGETDYVYFKEAKKSKTTKNKDKSTFFLVNQTKTIKDILKITGGSAPYSQFVGRYQKTKTKYSKLASENIVVIILDNDSGLSSVKATLTKVANTTEENLRTNEFTHLTENLYVVLTPLGDKFPSENSCVEHLFEEKVIKEKVRGKTFDPNLKKNEDTNTYGKGVFAHEVIAPKSKIINFENFDVIFDRVTAAQYHYNTIILPTLKS